MASPPDPELDDLRREVDRLDDAMVDLLAERMRVVGAIARIKQPAATGLPAIRPGREASILRRLVERAGDRLPGGHAGAHVARAAGGHHPCPGTARDRRLGAAGPAGAVGHRPRPVRLADPDPAGRRLVARAAAARRRRRRSSPCCRCRPSMSPGGQDCSTPRSGRCGSCPGCRSARRRLSRGERRLRGRRDRARAVRRRRQPGRGRDAGRGRPRAAARSAGGSRSVPRWLATRRYAETGTALHLLELDGFLARARSAACAGPPGPAREHVLRSVWLGSYARPLAAAG